MVAHKDYNMKKHKDVDVPNLYVIKLMQSMVSRGYVKEQFSWQWYYWYLTNEGIDFLREDLGLPHVIVPSTLKKPRTQQGERSERSERGDRGDRGDRREGGFGRDRFPRSERREEGGFGRPRGDRDGSDSGRPRDGDSEKKSDSAAPGYQPTFNRDTDRSSRGGDRGFGSDRRQGGGLGRGGGFSRDNRDDRSQGSSGYRREGAPSGDRQQRPSGGAAGAGAGTGAGAAGAAPRQDS